MFHGGIMGSINQSIDQSFTHLADSLAWRPPAIAACSYTSVCGGGRTGRLGAATRVDSWDGKDFQTRSNSVLEGHSGLEITRPEFVCHCHYTRNYGKYESQENGPSYWRNGQNTADSILVPRRLPEFILEKACNKKLVKDKHLIIKLLISAQGKSSEFWTRTLSLQACWRFWTVPIKITPSFCPFQFNNSRTAKGIFMTFGF